jgi:hypothetical protein
MYIPNRESRYSYNFNHSLVKGSCREKNDRMEYVALMVRNTAGWNCRLNDDISCYDGAKSEASCSFESGAKAA